MEFIKKGNHVLVISDTIDKKTGRPKEYRITPYACPFHDDGVEPQVHWFCNCPDFSIGRIGRGINPLVDPCKHVKEFLAREESARAMGGGD